VTSKAEGKRKKAELKTLKRIAEANAESPMTKREEKKQNVLALAFIWLSPSKIQNK
jgi:hypothetical protein